jgi:hypothetical protein
MSGNKSGNTFIHDINAIATRSFQVGGLFPSWIYVAFILCCCFHCTVQLYSTRENRKRVKSFLRGYEHSSMTVLSTGKQ